MKGRNMHRLAAIFTCSLCVGVNAASQAQDAGKAVDPKAAVTKAADTKAADTKAADTKAAPAADEGGKITLTGLVDGYYQYSFNHPPKAPGAAEVGGRSFDVKNDAFSLSVIEINVKRDPSKSFPIGITLTGTVGKTADLVHFTEPGTPTVRFLQQLFATYTTSGKMPISLDVGKFVTWTGYEVIESASNDHYSRGLLFTYAIPFYHTGIRATAPLTPKLTGGLYLVNGWNDVEDENGGKSYGASLSFTPTSTLNFVLNYLGGDEGGPANKNGAFGGIGYPTAVVLNTQLVDLLGTWNVTPKFKLGFNVDYASASKPGNAGGNWNGEAVYGKYQFTPMNAFALRLEHFEDTAGLRTGTAQNLNGVTATLEHVWKTNLVTRVEFRHDHAGTKFFPSGSGGGKDQDTITLSQVVKF